MQRSDITDNLAPPSFGFFGVAPHRVSLGQNADRPMFLASFDHGKRFSFRGVESGNGFPDVHAGMQHDPLVMKDAAKTFRLIEILRMGGNAIDPSILWPLLIMAVAFTLLFFTLHLAAMRNEILRRRVRSMRIMQAQEARA